MWQEKVVRKLDFILSIFVKCIRINVYRRTVIGSVNSILLQDREGTKL